MNIKKLTKVKNFIENLNNDEYNQIIKNNINFNLEIDFYNMFKNSNLKEFKNVKFNIKEIEFLYIDIINNHIERLRKTNKNEANAISFSHFDTTKEYLKKNNSVKWLNITSKKILNSAHSDFFSYFNFLDINAATEALEIIKEEHEEVEHMNILEYENREKALKSFCDAVDFILKNGNKNQLDKYLLIAEKYFNRLISYSYFSEELKLYLSKNLKDFKKCNEVEKTYINVISYFFRYSSELLNIKKWMQCRGNSSYLSSVVFNSAMNEM